MGIETERNLAFHCPLKEDLLLVRSLTGSEELGSCFEYHVTLYSLDHNVNVESLLNKEVSVEVRLGLSKPRYFSGIVCEISHRGMAGAYVVYEAVLRPWLWLLSRKSDCRIFQNETALDIVSKVFKEHDPQWFEVKLFGNLHPREYCVQYRESDLHFVSRLCEDEGLYYFFKHELGKHTLILTDSISAHEAASGFEKINYAKEVAGANEPVGMMLNWCATKRVVSTKVALTDFDFKKSLADLSAEGRNPAAPGNYEVYDYPGLYTEPDQGETRSRVRVEELGSGYDVVKGETNSRGLSTGNLFKLEGHPRDDQNRGYLLIGARYDIDSGTYASGDAVATFQFKSRITAIDAKTQFRPTRKTPEPLASGVQTAKVVGPRGQEIWTDSYARVKVQFHWDREGKHDESSSCWIRVAQMWAGPSWGGLHIPRIGQEVVVEFIDGNFDRPLIVGCVYNDANKPPYDLPSKATQSGIKSHSSAKAPPDHYNELRFEDKQGAEEIVVHAQRNLSTTVGHDATTTVQHDAKKTIVNNLSVAVSKGSYSTTVDTGPMTTTVPKNDYKLSAKQILEVGTNKIELNVGSCKVVIDQTAVTLTAFGSSVVLAAGGVTVTGTMIKLNS
jgi:type VI secretion system secreted protein VgrG